MRLYILKDQKITAKGYTRALDEVKSIFKNNANVDIKETMVEMDFTKVEGADRYTFDSLPYGFIKKHVDAIHAKDPGAYDHILFWVHRDNWLQKPPKKVWGENFSNFFYDYHVQVCRFDSRSTPNSVGTFWHEMHHPLDALIETELGVKVEPYLRVNSWDADITHGGGERWSYIRHKENQESLQYIAPFLRKAYLQRKKRYLKRKVALLQRVLQLVKELNRLKRVLLIKKTSKCHSQS